MIPFRSEKRAVILDEQRIAVADSARRRVLYGLLAIFLMFVFIVGFNPETDLQGARIAGTLFVVLLTAGASYVAGRHTGYIFSRASGFLELESSFFTVVLKKKRLMNLSEITCITLTTIDLLHTSAAGRHERASKRTLSGRFDSWINLYQLYIETPEKKVRIQEGTYREELEQSAVLLSRFLGVPVEKSSSR